MPVPVCVIMRMAVAVLVPVPMLMPVRVVVRMVMPIFMRVVMPVLMPPFMRVIMPVRVLAPALPGSALCLFTGHFLTLCLLKGDAAGRCRSIAKVPVILHLAAFHLAVRRL